MYLLNSENDLAVIVTTIVVCDTESLDRKVCQDVKSEKASEMAEVSDSPCG